MSFDEIDMITAGVLCFAAGFAFCLAIIGGIGPPEDGDFLRVDEGAPKRTNRKIEKRLALN